MDQNTIHRGLLLKGETAEDAAGGQEELEANAFAGLILMPTKAVRDQLEMLGINEKHISLDDILLLMNIFAVPYKACVLRLYECGVLSASRTKEYTTTEWKDIHSRIVLTGRAKRWQLDGEGTELFGFLLDDFAFNSEHEFLTAS